MNGQVIACPRGCQTVTDTATSLLAGPLHSTTVIRHSIGASEDSSGEYVVSCSAENCLPDIVISGIRFPVPAKAYIHQPRSRRIWN
uniref:Peptidase A1 domain-containing protein n=1 Tax=Apteryx owenii TaxID=8824 RepID=A0A8B9NTU1_APTOW